MPSAVNYKLVWKRYKAEQDLTLVLICFGSWRNWVQHTVDKDGNNAPGRVAGYYLVFTEGKGSADFELERESNLPLEKQHRTVALFTSIKYIHRTTRHKVPLGLLYSHLMKSAKVPSCFHLITRWYALCKGIQGAPFVLLVFVVNLRRLQLHPLHYTDLRAENSLIQVRVNSITMSWFMPSTSENTKEGCRSSVLSQWKKKELTGIPGLWTLANRPDMT